MSKKEAIISNILNGYHEYVTHSGGIFQMDWAEEILNRLIEFKGCNGYQLRINDKYTVNMSDKLFEFNHGHYEWFEIGSYIDNGVWHIGGKLVRIETEYKNEKGRI